MRIRESIITAVSLLLIGCSQARKQTYEISVRNDTHETIIPWLTKSAGVYLEAGWKSPEDIATERPGATEPYSFRPIPPGKTAEIPKVTGLFMPDSLAVLRVYLGPTTLDQILATDLGSPRRADTTLKPGRNDLVVTQKGGALQLDRAETSP